MNHPYLDRRYLVGFNTSLMGHIFTDVVVIGGGAAGLRAALEAARYGKVTVLCKDGMIDNNTYHAQGGLAAVMAADDTPEAHIADTIATGSGMGDPEVIETIIRSAPDHIRQMQEWGVAFDKGTDGNLSLGREGGHHANRVVHANGDASGKALIEALIEKVRSDPNIKVFENCFAVDFVTDPPAGGAGASVLGVLTYHQRYGMQVIGSKKTILASGGAGMLWRETSNPPGATADGLAMVFRAGGALADTEMMQFHPTTLYVAGSTRFLISEAVRGEGAYLLDRSGYRFMQDYHEMGELAPRDVVSRSINEQMSKTGATHVFLDVRHMGAEAFAKRFPQIDRKCRSFDIDPGNDLIPVHPAAHYMVGGAKTDIDGRTTLENLLACGEAACNGFHGANRLASNSLIEALVCGQKCGQLAGEGLADSSGKLTVASVDWSNPHSDRTELDLADVRNSLRSVMWRNVGIVRLGERLTETLEIIQFWGSYVLDKEFYDPAGWAVQNMLTSAFVITETALRRTETRGVHYREDFPQTDSVWQRRQVVRRTEHQLVVEQQ